MSAPLPSLGPHSLTRRHNLTPVTGGIIGCQPRFQRRAYFDHRRNNNPLPFHGDTYPLIGMQMGFPSNGRGQSDPEVIAPAFNIEKYFSHN
jgi:hypothetical protein